jgi:hypothetical protein
MYRVLELPVKVNPAEVRSSRVCATSRGHVSWGILLSKIY